MTNRKSAKNGVVHWLAGLKITAKRLVRLPSTVKRTIHTVKIIFVCSQKRQGKQINRKPSTNVDHPLNVQTNERKSIITWKLAGIVQR
ncbi:hypothetical protein [Virgibacillus sp. SK37]|uniref:hypothetical protein n=1 Tax=Virgibacillus sp. SK37 TaxID=403957 RepID=UPI0014443E85|nr:hypothetical protein [Virgibacillus sp. SK37]